MNLKKKFVIGAASLALVAGMGVAPAMAAEINLPNGLKVDTEKQRIAGDTRVETSLAAAKAAYKDHEGDAKTVYLVGYNGLIDAATSGMLDVQDSTRGPVVALPQDLKDQKLFALAVKKAFPKVNKFVAIGGTAVVSDEALKAVAEAAEVTKTDRIDGKNRYETNIAIAKKVFPAPTRVYLTRGDVMADAVSGGTLRNGPVIIVPRSGEVDPATVKYVTTAKPSQVIVIGGESALSDEQASKVFAKQSTIETTPWTAPEIIEGLKTKIQTYAALYFGQEAYQKGPTGTGNLCGNLNMTQKEANLPYAEINPAKVDDDNDGSTPAVQGTYFGLCGTDISTFTNKEETEEPADISVKAAMADGASASAKTKYFGGYAPIAEKVKAVEDYLNASTQLLSLTQAIETKLADGKGVTTYATIKAGTDDLTKALKAYYGAKFLTDNAVADKDGKITDQGLFTFDSSDVATAKLSGLNMDAIKDQVAADRNDKTARWAANGQAEGADLAIADLVKRDVTDFTALFGAAKTDTTNTKTDWAAVKAELDARYGEFTHNAKESKEMLIDAIRMYYTAGDLNGSSQSKTAGHVRIQGENRYETAAKLSIFQSKATSAPTNNQGESRLGEFKVQYLASGDDAHLADSVFAGQLQKGTILLVPTDGELNTLTKLELARKGAQKFANPMGETIFGSQVFTVGGKAAVSDDVFIDAVKALSGI